jgi:hypothetical protein
MLSCASSAAADVCVRTPQCCSQDGIYPLLLQLIDSPGSSCGQELTSNALELLSLMPTHPHSVQHMLMLICVSQRLVAARRTASIHYCCSSLTALAAHAAKS